MNHCNIRLRRIEHQERCFVFIPWLSWSSGYASWFTKLRHLEPFDLMNFPDLPPRQSGILTAPSVLQGALPSFTSWPFMVKVLGDISSCPCFHWILCDCWLSSFWNSLNCFLGRHVALGPPPTALATPAPSLLQNHLFSIPLPSVMLPGMLTSVLASHSVCPPRVASLIPNPSVSMYREHSSLCLLDSSFPTC